MLSRSKATWYADLRKIGGLEGQEQFPAGYCHFHAGTDERYFRQMTSEYLGSSNVKGRTVWGWKETGPNHLLDCRVYARAMAEYLGISRMTPAEWAIIARERGMPEAEVDLFSPRPLQVQAAASEAPAKPSETSAATRETAEKSAGWISHKPDWMGRK